MTFSRFLLCLAAVTMAQPQSRFDALLERIDAEQGSNQDSLLANQIAVFDSLVVMPEIANDNYDLLLKAAESHLFAGELRTAEALLRRRLNPALPPVGELAWYKTRLQELVASNRVDAKRKSMRDPRDGHRYPIIRRGGRTWMAKNLDWKTPTSGCWGDLPHWCPAFGRLYDFASARTACPPGWRLPQPSDWKALLATSKFMAEFKGPELRGTNETGFHVMPGGYSIGPISKSSQKFVSLGTGAEFWADQEPDGPLLSWGTATRDNPFESSPAQAGALYSVRCVQDAPAPHLKPTPKKP